MHLSMLSPRGDLGHMWGIWPLLPFPPLGIWLRIWIPGWGHLLFLCRGIGPSHIIPCARLCAARLWKPWKTFVFNVSTCFIFLQKHFLSLLIFNISWWNTLPFGDCVDCWWYGLAFGRPKHWKSIKYYFIHWLGGGYLIRYDQILGPHGGILTKNFLKSQMPHICPGCPPSPSGLTLIDA